MKTRIAALMFAASLIVGLGVAPAGADIDPCAEPGVILGTSGNDTIPGTAGNDVICGLGGIDSIRGNGGNDTIYGGDGNDKIAGGNGDDTIYGETGTQDMVLFTSATGPITADLSTGTSSGQGSDIFSGMEGLQGATYADMLTGNSGDNKLLGGGGTDTMDDTTGGADKLLGQGGGDTIDGRDTIAGNDTIDGGADSDTCGADGTDAKLNCEADITQATTTTVVGTAGVTDLGGSYQFEAGVPAATFQASVVPAVSGTPTGSVEFFFDGFSQGVVALNGSGQASLTIPTPCGGGCSVFLTASYSGDAGYDPSATDPVLVSVVPI